MKRLFAILIFLLACAGVAEAQTNFYITATLTITNLATNGDTFTINNNTRLCTNVVTNVQTQIAVSNVYSTYNLTNQQATNLFNAYAQYPEISPYIVNISWLSSNQIQFQGVPGASLVLSTNLFNAGCTNWVEWTLTTNAIGWQETVVRVPTNGIGVGERTNVENGLAGYLGSADGLLGPVNYQGSMWSNFANIVLLQAATTNGYFAEEGSLVKWKTNFTTSSTSTYTPWTNNYYVSQTNGILGLDIYVTAGNTTNAATTNICFGKYVSAFWMTTAAGTQPTGFLITNGTQYGTALGAITNTYASTGAIGLQITPATVSLEHWTVEVDVRANPRPATWPVLPGP